LSTVGGNSLAQTVRNINHGQAVEVQRLLAVFLAKREAPILQTYRLQCCFGEFSLMAL